MTQHSPLSRIHAKTGEETCMPQRHDSFEAISKEDSHCVCFWPIDRKNSKQSSLARLFFHTFVIMSHTSRKRRSIDQQLPELSHSFHQPPAYLPTFLPGPSQSAPGWPLPALMKSYTCSAHHVAHAITEITTIKPNHGGSSCDSLPLHRLASSP